MEEGCRENPAVFSTSDRVILRRMIDNPKPGQEEVKQQGIYESLIRDMMVGFGKWDFDPLELENPFPENDGNPVQIW
ncbi:hypothetical protein MKW92_017684 [Papaver armeniacum]|nr:hypothetical protein MKW92_017684 [Papaver armeniacum]